MRSFSFFVALALCLSSAWAGSQPLVTISDPAGDDFGDGTLIYPQRSDFQSGDLDLLQLQVSRDNEGVRFEATFRNPIHDPASVPHASVGPESLATFARKGFYQFNLDLYVDTDRIPGSGNTFTLPGRQVRIDRDFAWEKAVILTPRPELMRQQLLDALAELFPDRKAVELESKVDQSIFFPTQIKVRGKTISFVVPGDFFSGSDGADWAVTAFVTGAMTVVPADFSLVSSSKTALERLQLGVMQPMSGHPRDSFGYSGAVPGPVVDLLGGSAEQQMQLLGVKGGLRGYAWGEHAAEPRPAAAHTTPATVVAIEKWFRKDESRIDQPAAVVPEVSPAVPEDKSIAKRLETLQQLYDRKLIDEQEYRQQRQRILQEL